MDTWTIIVRVGGSIFLLIILIYGIDKLRGELRYVKLRNCIFIFLSFLVLPLMFGTCTAINELAPDKTHDVFGYKRPAVEEKKGYETKSMRRERGMENIIEFFTSKHGWVSILCAIGTGVIFMILISLISKNIESEPINSNDGYLAITAVIGILCLIMWSNS